MSGECRKCGGSIYGMSASDVGPFTCGDCEGGGEPAFATSLALDAARERVAVLEDALRFYADPGTYATHDFYSSAGQDFPYATSRPAVDRDAGDIARAALEAGTVKT